MFAGVTLDRHADDVARFVFGFSSGFLQNLPGQLVRLPRRVPLDLFEELPPRLLRAQSRRLSQLLAHLPHPLRHLPLPLRQRLASLRQAGFLFLQRLLRLHQPLELRINQPLPFAQPPLQFCAFSPSGGERLFRLLAQLQRLLVGRQQRLLLDPFRFPPRLGEQLLRLDRAHLLHVAVLPPPEHKAQRRPGGQEEGAFKNIAQPNHSKTARGLHQQPARRRQDAINNLTVERHSTGPALRPRQQPVIIAFAPAQSAAL